MQSVQPSKFIVLVCGLNIRSHNRITLADQLSLLRSSHGLLAIEAVRDKGSYLVTTHLNPAGTIQAVVNALGSRLKELPSAAVTTTSQVSGALTKLTANLRQRYGDAFSEHNFEIDLNEEPWRGGLAFPLYPTELPQIALPFHKTKNAVILGISGGAALIAKREAKNIHWGTTVNDPCKRLIRMIAGVDVALTSRSGNVMRDLVNLSS
jgi:hypothetical protein